MNIYEGIFKEITTLKCEYESSTGLKPTKLYIGRNQAIRLERWCYDVGSIEEPCAVFTEDLSRPVVAGLDVYLVNADDLMCCCN